MQLVWKIGIGSRCCDLFRRSLSSSSWPRQSGRHNSINRICNLVLQSYPRPVYGFSKRRLHTIRRPLVIKVFTLLFPNVIGTDEGESECQESEYLHDLPSYIPQGYRIQWENPLLTSCKALEFRRLRGHPLKRRRLVARPGRKLHRARTVHFASCPVVRLHLATWQSGWHDARAHAFASSLPVWLSWAVIIWSVLSNYTGHLVWNRIGN